MGRTTAALAAVVTVASIVALVVLVVQNKDVAPLLTLAGPILASLYVARQNDQQQQQLGTIERRVNGELDARMARIVQTALDDKFGEQG